ncbi:hypothetical protein Tco_1525076 [Tanacetum coccineum]
MSTLVSVDLEISTQADRAQSPRVHVPFPKDPYEAIRQAYLVGTDTESEPFEDPIETEALESPHTITLPTSLPDKKVAAMSDLAFRKRFRSSYESLPSSSPPDLPSWKHYRDTSELVEDDEEEEDDKEEDEEIEESLNSDSVIEDAEDEGPTTENEDPAAGDEGLVAGDKGPGMGVESLSLGGDEAVPEGQQRAAPVMETAIGEPLGLGYGALRHQEITFGEGRMPSVFEPTLTTWIDPKGGIAYIDVPAYLPPAPPAQTPPSPDWSSGSLIASLAPSIVPSPISSPMIPLTVPSPVASPVMAETKGFLTELGARVEMQRGLIRDHTVRLGKLSPALFERNLKHEQERVAVTFRAIWRPVLAMDS